MLCFSFRIIRLFLLFQKTLARRELFGRDGVCDITMQRRLRHNQKSGQIVSSFSYALSKLKWRSDGDIGLCLKLLVISMRYPLCSHHGPSGTRGLQYGKPCSKQQHLFM